MPKDAGKCVFFENVCFSVQENVSQLVCKQQNNLYSWKKLKLFIRDFVAKYFRMFICAYLKTISFFIYCNYVV